MGGANNICSDKTGTLTENKMTVTDIWLGRELTFSTGPEDVFKFTEYFKNDKHAELFKQAISCNTIGTAEESSATEKAMLILIKKF